MMRAARRGRWQVRGEAKALEHEVAALLDGGGLEDHPDVARRGQWVVLVLVEEVGAAAVVESASLSEAEAEEQDEEDRGSQM